MSNDWSNDEVELIVEDYFNMLEDELEGTHINKAEHRRILLPRLNNRNAGSIEFKHQNISAVLIELKQPFIKGYQPRFNYQKILAEKVIQYLDRHLSLETKFEQFANTPATKKSDINFGSFNIPPPITQNAVAKKKNTYRPIRINYLEKEQNNGLLGAQGEEMIIQYEKWRLISLGKELLADTVERVSKTRGDGCGYDILSKNEDGSDRFIEVKTTKLSIETPIFFSKNEFDFSTENASQYYLYRLFNFADNPKMFMIKGSFDSFCNIEPIQFKGSF